VPVGQGDADVRADEPGAAGDQDPRQARRRLAAG
jgi:hypothetical protein